MEVVEFAENEAQTRGQRWKPVMCGVARGSGKLLDEEKFKRRLREREETTSNKWHGRNWKENSSSVTRKQIHFLSNPTIPHITCRSSFPSSPYSYIAANLSSVLLSQTFEKLEMLASS
ncbi:hypothetical protein L6452_18067 [Arctium lappa]|uniref:Uncharacterized protein n=1 Tax=Arctium lappa TaxID=4217 RepID=A0ACB9C5E5_ARCLA|nr:hypothetical protein L6452_18067 [Arctium lappa]